MDSLSTYGVRSGVDRSLRSFLITMMGAGVMLGYARSGLSTLDAILSETGTTGQRPRTIPTDYMVRHRS
jgi:hypothetical protein